MFTSLSPVFLVTLLKEAESSSNAVSLLLEDGDSPRYHFLPNQAMLLSLLTQTNPADNIQPLLTLRPWTHTQKMEAGCSQALRVTSSRE